MTDTTGILTDEIPEPRSLADIETQVERWDTRWRAQLGNAERFLTCVHELDREPEDAS